MKFLTLAFIFCLPVLAAADGVVPYGGLGLQIGSTAMQNDLGTSKTKFVSQGYVVEGGVDFAFGAHSGFRVGAEFGAESGSNSSTSNQYMETSANSTLAAKAGLYAGRFEVGAGYRRNSMNVKSLSTLDGTNYLESNYEGYAPYGFGAVIFDLDKKYRFSIEGQYVTGKLKSSDTSLSDIKLNEMNVGLRFFFLFN